LEGIRPPAVATTKDSLVQQECSPSLLTRLSLMKLWVAPESKNFNGVVADREGTR
jgi:hypothetical protein